MKSKYCFLRSSGKLCPGDVVYQVWVGSFLREFTKLTLVQEYCKDCGLYFEKWSPMVDSRLDEMKSRYVSSGNVLTTPFLSASITIDKLYAMIIDDTFDSFEASLFLTSTEKWQRYRQTIRYHLSLSKSNVLQNVNPSVRKNLSLRNRHEVQKTLFLFLCLVVLIIIDAIVTNLANW